MMVPPFHQECRWCRQTLLMTRFYFSADGRVSTACKLCTTAAMRASRETPEGRAKALAKAERQRAEYAQNAGVRAKLVEKANRYYHENKEQVRTREKARRSTEAGKAKVRAFGMRQRARPDAKERRRAYEQSERGKAALAYANRPTPNRLAAYQRYHQSEAGKASQARFLKSDKARAAWRRGAAKRRARIAGQAGVVATLTAAEWLAIKEAAGHACHYCGRTDRPLTQDHVIPLARGGPHVKENIVPACQTCNSRKGSKLLAPGTSLTTSLSPPSQAS